MIVFVFFNVAIPLFLLLLALKCRLFFEKSLSLREKKLIKKQTNKIKASETLWEKK